MTTYTDHRLQLTHRLQGIVNSLGSDIAESLEGALEKVEGKLFKLAAMAEETESLIKRKKYVQKEKEEIQKLLKNIYEEIGETSKEKIIETAQAAPEITNAIVKKTHDLTVEMGVPKLSKKRVLAYFESTQIEGLFYNDYLKKLEQNAVGRIMKEIKEAMLFNESYTQTARRIQNALDIGRRSALGFVQTGMNQAWNWAEHEYYLENKEKLKGFIYRAMLDRKTTPTCRDLDGRQFPIKEAPIPPLHWKCRSHLEPIFIWDTEKTLGKRIARIDTEPRTVRHRAGGTSTKYESLRVKHVPATMSYNDWLMSMIKSKNPKDVSFAREVLGPKRFSLVSSGKLKMESLYYHGKLRTIKDLKELMK